MLVVSVGEEVVWTAVLLLSVIGSVKVEVPSDVGRIVVVGFSLEIEPVVVGSVDNEVRDGLVLVAPLIGVVEGGVAVGWLAVVAVGTVTVTLDTVLVTAVLL